MSLIARRPLQRGEVPRLCMYRITSSMHPTRAQRSLVNVRLPAGCTSLGLSLDAKTGVVTGTTPRSLAAACVKPGDLLLSINGHGVTSLAPDLVENVRATVFTFCCVCVCLLIARAVRLLKFWLLCLNTVVLAFFSLVWLASSNKV